MKKRTRIELVKGPADGDRRVIVGEKAEVTVSVPGAEIPIGVGLMYIGGVAFPFTKGAFIPRKKATYRRTGRSTGDGAAIYEPGD